MDVGALQVAWLVPPFGRGSEEHAVVAHLVRGLEARGHRCGVWVVDPEGREEDASEAELGRGWQELFGPVDGRVRRWTEESWEGADVAVACGWQTVPRTLLVPGVAARMSFVQDYEPDLHPASASREWAAWSYEQGLDCMALTPWLAEKLRREHGARTVPLDPAVDHEVFKPLAIERREDLVLFRARAEVARNAVPLGALALEELHRRRGDSVQIVLFDDARPLELPFPHRTLGVIEGEELAQAFNAATVGLALDLSVPSQICGSMLACGLPVVDLATEATFATFGTDGPIALAPADPLALCDAIEHLLDDFEQRAARVRVGLEWAESRTWQATTGQVAAALAAAVERAGADLR